MITQKQYKQIVRASKSGTTPSQRTKLGSYIMIHGNGSEADQVPQDWTWGCMALSNDNIDDLYETLGLSNHRKMSTRNKREILQTVRVGIVRYGSK